MVTAAAHYPPCTLEGLCSCHYVTQCEDELQLLSNDVLSLSSHTVIGGVCLLDAVLPAAFNPH